MLDYGAGAGYPRNVWDTDADGRPDHQPVAYLFCGDERTNDISWCSRSDAGESFQEAVDFYRRRWEEGYPLSYYRRFRRSGPSNTLHGHAVSDAVKIYQHLFFRYFNEAGFASDFGPLGAADQFDASVDVMNWLTELTQLPEVGSYQFDAATCQPWLSNRQ